MSDNTVTGSLVIVSAEYGADGWSWWRQQSPRPTGDAATFYAVPTPDLRNWRTVLMPEDDPRHAGAWEVSDASRDAYGLPDDGKRYRAWNVPEAMLQDVPGGAQETPGEDEAPTVPTFTVEDLERARDEARRDERRRLTDEFETWKARATEIAHQYADDNSLCSEFDRCMEAVGLPPRSRMVMVQVRSFAIEIAPRDVDDRDEIARALADHYGVDTYAASQFLNGSYGDIAILDEDGDELRSW